MIMGDQPIYFLENVDMNHNSEIKLRFTSRSVGDVSPVVGLLSLENPACALVTSGSVRV